MKALSKHSLCFRKTFIRLRIRFFVSGKEKVKTKAINNTVNPKWREGFDLYWYEEFDNNLEISVYDKDIGSKDDFMGR